MKHPAFRAFPIGVAALLVAVDCEDSRRLPARPWTAAAQSVSVGGTVLGEQASPKQVAEATLKLLKRSVAIRRQGLGDPARAAEFQEVTDTIRRLGAAEALHEAALADPYHLMPKDVTTEQAVEELTNAWPAVVAHYIDGVMPQTMAEQVQAPDHMLVTVEAENAEDRAVMAELDRMMSDQRDERGELLHRGRPAFEQRLREAAIERGVVPPIRATIRLSLARESGYWRVSRVTVGAGPGATSQ